jgi:hypothetical protein
MNTLQKRKQPNTDILSVTNFREYQYSIIPYFASVAMEYLLKFGNRYINVKNIDFKERINYIGLFNSCFSELIIKTDAYTTDEEKYEKTFLNILIPTLLDGCTFNLNGTIYVPAMYVVDYPIIIKEKSIQFYGLLNGLTIYFKDDIAILTGINIPLSYFFQLFFEKVESLELYNAFLKNHKKQHDTHPDEEIVTYFRNAFGNNNIDDIDKARQFISDVIFDYYTDELYNTCYSSSDLEYLLVWALNKYIHKDTFNFVDLANKRLIFIELLLRPFFDKIANFAKQVWRGILYDEIKIDNMSIIKYFRASGKKQQTNTAGKKMGGLSGNYIYEPVNFFSSIPQHKVNMVSPGVEHPPKEIQTIHETHFGRICPITVSSQKPGRTVSLIPYTEVDRFGRFI